MNKTWISFELGKNNDHVQVQLSITDRKRLSTVVDEYTIDVTESSLTEDQRHNRIQRRW